MNDFDITLTPYIHFSGNCEEALNTYKEVLGGSIEVEQRYDNPNMKAPDDYKDKILHARFLYGDHLMFMACDVFPGQSAKKGSGDTALSINVNNLEEAKRIFSEFEKAGEVHVPFEKQFWGDWHGNLTDSYGIRWMVNYMK